MFTVRVEVWRGEVLTGLEALDERRRLGLPDGSLLGIGEYGSMYARAPVSEAVARACFARDERENGVFISREMLSRGDVVESGTGWKLAALSPERVIELWYHGRLRREEAKVAELATRVAELEVGVPGHPHHRKGQS
jgi:hypothetical protein